MGKTSLIVRAGSGEGRKFLLCDGFPRPPASMMLAKKLLEAAPEQKGKKLMQTVEIAGKVPEERGDLLGENRDHRENYATRKASTPWSRCSIFSMESGGQP